MPRLFVRRLTEEELNGEEDELNDDAGGGVEDDGGDTQE